MNKPVQSIERGMRMLEFIARADGAAGLGAIANAAGVRASTAHNILATLTGLGYVQRRASGTGYYLGHRILNLARIAGDDDALRRRFRPLVRTVAERFGESVYLIVPGGDELYYLDGLELANNPAEHSRLGRREPLSGSAIGLVLAAFMPGVEHALLVSDDGDLAAQIDTVRTLGFATERGRYQRGLHCVAIPLRVDGHAVAGLCLNGSAARLPQRKLEAIGRFMADEALRAPADPGV